MSTRAGAQALANSRALNGEDATYARPGVFTGAEIKVTPGQSTTEAESGDVIIEYTSFDFLVNVDQLLNDSTAFLPESGDVVTFNGNDYTVYAPPGERCFRYHDRFELTVRIHTTKDGASS